MSRTILLPTLALLLCSAVTITAQTTDTTTAPRTPWHWTTGIRINQGQPFGLIGVTKKLGPRVFQYAGADFGGIQRSMTTQTLVRITSPQKLELYALLGPQIETVLSDPDPQTTIDYLTGASGLLLNYNRNQNLSVWTAFTYLWTDAPIKRWKFGFGLTLPIDLAQ
jgi:hypothetical protein